MQIEFNIDLNFVLFYMYESLIQWTIELSKRIEHLYLTVESIWWTSDRSLVRLRRDEQIRNIRRSRRSSPGLI